MRQDLRGGLVGHPAPGTPRVVPREEGPRDFTSERSEAKSRSSPNPRREHGRITQRTGRWSVRRSESMVGADVLGGPPPARNVWQPDLVRGAGRARGTRAPTNAGALMRQGRCGGLGGRPRRHPAPRAARVQRAPGRGGEGVGPCRIRTRPARPSRVRAISLRNAPRRQRASPRGRGGSMVDIAPNRRSRRCATFPDTAERDDLHGRP